MSSIMLILSFKVFIVALLDMDLGIHLSSILYLGLCWWCFLVGCLSWQERQSSSLVPGLPFRVLLVSIVVIISYLVWVLNTPQLIFRPNPTSSSQFRSLTSSIRPNPFASIGRTGKSKGKVEVRDICLNISFLTSFLSFFTPIWKKVQSLLFIKKVSWYISPA